VENQVEGIAQLLIKALVKLMHLMLVQVQVMMPRQTICHFSEMQLIFYKGVHGYTFFYA
jgi:hypothetical protein